MRLRLVHTLSLLLLAAVLLSVLIMGGLMAWNLRTGFADYLAARDLARLERFAHMVSGHVELAGGVKALHREGVGMRELLREFAEHEGMAIPERDPAAWESRPPPGPPDGFGRRVALYDLDGLAVLGRPIPRELEHDLIEQPIQMQGQTVAWARMVPLPPEPDGLDMRFLKRQYGRMATVAAALLVLALVCARWVAGKWVRPLVAVRQAVARIAQGELNVRLHHSAVGEIGDVVDNINRMAEGLQRLDGARRRWMADISHELRTPLAVLRGEVEALTDGVRPLSREAMLSLQEEVLRLGKLVDDLHLLAMSDLQSLPCQFVDTDAHAMLQRIARRFEHRAAERGLRVMVDLAHDEPLQVTWDEARIEQVLGNLVENSLRYTDAPGQILLRLRRVGRTIEVDVDDSAPGVPAAQMSRLFEPLYRADQARSRHSGGSGLGLAICEAIVAAHGGRIKALASPLGGLRVHMDLPLVAGVRQ